METNEKEYTDDDLGVFILDKQCLEMEQMIRGVGYCLVITVICVTIIVSCMLLL